MNGAGHLPGDWLSAFVDGELASDDAAAAQSHLADCTDCAGEAARFGLVRASLRNAPVPAQTPDWENRLVERMLAADRSTVVGLRRRAAATAAAVAALAAAVVLAFAPHDPTAAPAVGRMVVSHATSSGASDPSGLAPAAVSASFGRP
jgi:anti-sigma factor RsiW